MDEKACNSRILTSHLAKTMLLCSNIFLILFSRPFLAIISEVRETAYQDIFFAGVEIKEVDNEYVMVGNFIKETQYKVVTTVQEGVLASTPADVPTAPYSRFIVFLKNHRMVLVRNETASPDTRSFQSTVRDILNQYVRNANRERSERDKLPIAIANIVDIPLKDSIADVLKNVNKVSWFKLRFFPLNNDLDPGPLTQHIREDMKKVGSKTTNIVFNSPNSKDGISKMIAESSGLAVASLQIVDNTGEKRRVKEGSFSSTIKIEYEGNIRPNGDEYLIIQAKKDGIISNVSPENERLYEQEKEHLKALMS